jgi:hypothetical protein
MPVQIDLAKLARSTRAPGFARFVSWPLASSSSDSQAVLKLFRNSPERRARRIWLTARNRPSSPSGNRKNVLELGLN